MTRAALFALFVPLISGSAHAFEIRKSEQGAQLHLTRRSFSYAVDFALGDGDGEHLSAASRAAFDAWGSAAKGRVLPIYRWPGEDPVFGDMKWTVAIVDMWDPADGEADRTLATTRSVYDVVSGELYESDLLLNGEGFRFSSGEDGSADTISVIVHEAGHAIGFAHSCGERGAMFPSCFDIADNPPGTRDRILEAAMAPTLSVGSQRRALGADDIAGLVALYSVSATTAAPRIDRLLRVCGSGALELQGIRFPLDPIVEARGSNAHIEPVSFTADSAAPDRLLHIESVPDLAPAGTFDIIVRDRVTAAYGALIAVEIVDGCAPEMDAGVPDSGTTADLGSSCGCTAAGRQTDGAPLMISVLIAMAFALRRFGLAALFVVALPNAAYAFRCSRVGADFGPSLTWSQRSIPWVADAAGSDDISDSAVTMEQLRLSFQAWVDVDCSDLELPFMGTRPDARAEFLDSGPNANTVVFIETGWKYDSTVIALTTNAFDTKSGVMLDSDIEVNGTHFKFAAVDGPCDPETSNTTDLRNVITHEAGHVIGLDHPPNTPRYEDATMYASAPPCETKKRTLAQDDIEGLCSIYPAGQPTDQCFPPDGPSFALVGSNDGFGGCTAAPGEGSAEPIILFAGLVAVLTTARRRRRKLP